MISHKLYQVIGFAVKQAAVTAPHLPVGLAVVVTAGPVSQGVTGTVAERVATRGIVCPPDKVPVLVDWFGVELEDMPWLVPSFNVAPQSVQPLVRLNGDVGNRKFALLRWGSVPFWAKEAKIGHTTINARAEEAPTKPAFREASKKRRCLVPVAASRFRVEASLRNWAEER
jgi:hypothetical protein